MLELREVDAHYGPSWILKGISLDAPAGGVVSLLGRNGAGKSTTLKTIAGLIAPTRGSIRFAGESIAGLAAHTINRRGIAYVPEERRIFGDLTVAEHLAIAAQRGGWSGERVYSLFPALAPLHSRRGRVLSGGEQQMLAIGRALATGPRLLLLDEPTQGLAPVVVDAMLASIATLRAEGLAIVLVEQNVGVALDVSDTAIVIDRGTIVFNGTSAELRARPDLASAYLGVGDV